MHLHGAHGEGASGHWQHTKVRMMLSECRFASRMLLRRELAVLSGWQAGNVPNAPMSGMLAG